MPEKPESELPKGQPVWVIEKFIPTRCPAPGCRQEFRENGPNGYCLGTYWLHERHEEIQRIVDSIRCPGLATDLVVCGKCHNVTLRVKIEERRYLEQDRAEAVARTDGFTKPWKAESFGTDQLEPGTIMVTRFLNTEGAEASRHILFTKEGTHEF